ncbi:DUF3150 domain-containing protein [Pseudomonas guariconensis]|uniref:DUF3150 domain-containing protein n=1 Tax=Pseudomonas guariconensis TaxID=1288410 RepID=UPI003906710C
MTNVNVNSAVQVVAQTVDSRVAVINHLITCVSEDRQIDLSYMDVEVKDLPKATRKLLCEKIFPQDFLRPYHRIREHAEEILDRNGSIKTALGGINSLDSAIEKIAELEVLKKEWNKQLEKDEARYSKMCEAHILKIGDAALASGVTKVMSTKLTTVLLKRQPTWDEVKKSLQFSYVVHLVDLDGGDFIPQLEVAQRDSVVAIREGVLGACIQHVCAEALALLKLIDKKDRTAANGLVKLNPRTIRRARAMTDKLAPLAFIHQLIRPLHDALKAELAKLPNSGSMTANEFENFVECLKALCDQRKVVDHLHKGIPLISISMSPQQPLFGASQSTPQQQRKAVQKKVTSQPGGTVAPATTPAAPSTANAVQPAQKRTKAKAKVTQAKEKPEATVPAELPNMTSATSGRNAAAAFYM